MKGPTVSDLIVEWLALTNRHIVASHELECEFPLWVRELGMLGYIDNECTIPRGVNPSTVSRRWRELREDKNGFTTRTVEGGRTQGTWEILTYDGLPWTEYINQGVNQC